MISGIKTQGQSCVINSSPNDLSNAGQTQKKELVYKVLNKYCYQTSLHVQKQVKKTGKVFLAVMQTNTPSIIEARFNGNMCVYIFAHKYSCETGKKKIYINIFVRNCTFRYSSVTQ